MAGSSLLALIDDIATLLDDVSVMTKVAAQKTAGVLGDDLALNAQQVTGVRADRELPVVWAVTKGSLKNKLFLVPAALAISATIPWLITPLLMLGGLFLCFEGFEKLAHKFFHDHSEDEKHHQEMVDAIASPEVDMVAYEKKKIKGAIRTDMILSAEIIVIALGTVQEYAFGYQVAVVSTIALVMTLGVYGLVAGIVKLDDAGLYLMQSTGEDGWSKTKYSIGKVILALAPKLMKTLSVVGTAAMFLVGGGILMHGIPGAEHLLHAAGESVAGVPAIGGLLEFVTPSLLGALGGIVAGGITLMVVSLVSGLVNRIKGVSEAG
ncbi:hypothetical protein BTA51_22700 [Hahella sp. CCB-MM4]|uniref:DUF808 domain-containing protein n=1 Tax=Hahella sp. (strain CCB-MM4) TaxID=1926491 RepID=UPI000B9B659B|nr:DUF808 domain-containing protein [Hahella sp. CCB-MM4]OZG71183.1 hypothetical protein BTA51_22700 [Hahella sp. CCB-MM4]